MEMTDDLKTVMDCATHMMKMAARIHEYRSSWGDKFCLDELEEAYLAAQKELRTVNFFDFNENQLKLARFGHWDNDIWLCPLYLREILKPTADNDERMGCISDGWRMVDGKLDPNKPADIFSDEKGNKTNE